MRNAFIPSLFLVAPLAVAPPLAHAQCTDTNPSACTIAPARLEVNLGPVPIDRYFNLNRENIFDASSPVIIGGGGNKCSNSETVQHCIKRMFNNNPYDPNDPPPLPPNDSNNFVGQGVTGVRFQFGLGGGGYSTPFNFTFDSSKWNSQRYTYTGLNSSWLGSLRSFFADLYSYGIRYVTPTPVIMDWWSGDCGAGCINLTNIRYADPCVTGKTACSAFFPWAPFGLAVDNSKWPRPADRNRDDFYPLYLPEGWELNEAYNCASSNRVFWGWTPLFDLIEQVLDAARYANYGQACTRTPCCTQPPCLTVAELDLQNETDMVEFTAMGRLVYDNKHNEDGTPGQTDVLNIMRVLVTQSGFTDTRATYSVQPWMPNVDSANCDSAYLDKAMVIRQSALWAAITGSGPVGRPQNATEENFQLCGGDLYQEGNPKYVVLPAHTPPTVLDIHAYVCGNSPCAVNQPPYLPLPAINFYNAVKSFLDRRSLPTTTFVAFGETHWLQGQSPCGINDTIQAFKNVWGFMDSNLAAWPNAAFRIWENPGKDEEARFCFVIPEAINPPYKP